MTASRLYSNVRHGEQQRSRRRGRRQPACRHGPLRFANPSAAADGAVERAGGDARPMDEWTGERAASVFGAAAAAAAAAFAAGAGAAAGDDGSVWPRVLDAGLAKAIPTDFDGRPGSYRDYRRWLVLLQRLCGRRGPDCEAEGLLTLLQRLPGKAWDATEHL
jgi:hypothetical protein